MIKEMRDAGMLDLLWGIVKLIGIFTAFAISLVLIGQGWKWFWKKK